MKKTVIAISVVFVTVFIVLFYQALVKTSGLKNRSFTSCVVDKDIEHELRDIKPVQCWTFDDNRLETFTSENENIIIIEVPGYSKVKVEQTKGNDVEGFNRIDMNPKRLLNNVFEGFFISAYADSISADLIRIDYKEGTELIESHRTEQNVLARTLTQGFAVANLTKNQYDFKFELKTRSLIEVDFENRNGMARITISKLKNDIKRLPTN